jgi:hypothetical protein
MCYTPSGRHLWTMYKNFLACEDDIDRRNLVQG